MAQQPRAPGLKFTVFREDVFDVPKPISRSNLVEFCPDSVKRDKGHS